MSENKIANIIKTADQKLQNDYDYCTKELAFYNNLLQESMENFLIIIKNLNNYNINVRIS